MFTEGTTIRRIPNPEINVKFKAFMNKLDGKTVTNDVEIKKEVHMDSTKKYDLMNSIISNIVHRDVDEFINNQIDMSDPEALKESIASGYIPFETEHGQMELSIVDGRLEFDGTSMGGDNNLFFWTQGLMKTLSDKLNGLAHNKEIEPLYGIYRPKSPVFDKIMQAYDKDMANKDYKYGNLKELLTTDNYELVSARGIGDVTPNSANKADVHPGDIIVNTNTAGFVDNSMFVEPDGGQQSVSDAFRPNRAELEDRMDLVKKIESMMLDIGYGNPPSKQNALDICVRLAEDGIEIRDSSFLDAYIDGHNKAEYARWGATDDHEVFHEITETEALGIMDAIDIAVERGLLSERPRDWYMKKFPTDELGPELPYGLTWDMVAKSMADNDGYLDYSLLGRAVDSSVRERLQVGLDDREVSGRDIDRLLAGMPPEIQDENLVIEDNVLVEMKGEAEHVSVPEGVTKIGDYALENHKELKKCELPDSLKSIGDRAFADTGLESIDIPDGVKSIGREAFTRCDDMTRATVGQDTMISKDAFPEKCEIERRGEEPKQEQNQQQNKKIYADITH